MRKKMHLNAGPLIKEGERERKNCPDTNETFKIDSVVDVDDYLDFCAMNAMNE
jgi:hypothetical protein